MLLAIRDLKWPDISTTLTTAWIFAAMLFMSGIIGKFIFSIPFVIMTTILISLVLSLTIVPTLTLFFQGDTSKKHTKIEKKTFWNRRFVSLEPFILRYEQAILYLLATRGRLWRFLAIVVGIFLFSVALPALGILKTEFFPADNQDIVYINMTAEPGQQLARTSQQISAVEDLLRREPADIVASFTTTVGGAVSVQSIGGGGGSATNLASVTINLKKKNE